jgi:hypothetical protein
MKVYILRTHDFETTSDSKMKQKEGKGEREMVAA